MSDDQVACHMMVKGLRHSRLCCGSRKRIRLKVIDPDAQPTQEYTVDARVCEKCGVVHITEQPWSDR